MSILARVFCLGLVLLALAAPVAQACTRLPNAATLTAQLLTEVNTRRSRAALPRLAREARLERAAWAVACENATRNRLSHTTADGGTLTTRVARVGYRWRVLNENLAMANGTPAQVVQMWMNSPGHRANILARGTVHFGAAVARSASGRLYWAMVSAAPR